MRKFGSYNANLNWGSAHDLQWFSVRHYYWAALILQIVIVSYKISIPFRGGWSQPNLYRSRWDFSAVDCPLDTDWILQKSAEVVGLYWTCCQWLALAAGHCPFPAGQLHCRCSGSPHFQHLGTCCHRVVSPRLHVSRLGFSPKSLVVVRAANLPSAASAAAASPYSSEQLPSSCFHMSRVLLLRYVALEKPGPHYRRMLLSQPAHLFAGCPSCLI